MKSANEMPLFDAGKFMEKNEGMIEAQLMFGAIELNLFEYLEEPICAERLAERLNYDETNLKWLLQALTAMDFLVKKDEGFQNLPETQYYLHPKSEMYLGEQLLYWKDMTSMDGLTDLVRKGAPEKRFKDENGSDFFDFQAMGRGNQTAMYLGRVQHFISAVKRNFRPEQKFSVLDMGCGCGIFSIEILRNFPSANAVLFDQKAVTELARRAAEAYGVAARSDIRTGNFVTDEIKGRYDLLIASGIMDFVGDLDKMTEKMKGLVSDRGMIFVSTHGLNDDFTKPKSMVLGWLSSHLHGLSILKTDRQIRESFEKSGFILSPVGRVPGQYFARIDR